MIFALMPIQSLQSYLSSALCGSTEKLFVNFFITNFNPHTIPSFDLLKFKEPPTRSFQLGNNGFGHVDLV